MESRHSPRTPWPLRGRRAYFAAAIGSLLLIAGCDAILGIPGHLETSPSGGSSGSGGSGATGGDSGVVVRSGRLATIPATAASSGTTKVTRHAFELRTRVCDGAKEVCVRGGLTAGGPKEP